MAIQEQAEYDNSSANNEDTLSPKPKLQKKKSKSIIKSKQTKTSSN